MGSRSIEPAEPTRLWINRASCIIQARNGCSHSANGVEARRTIDRDTGRSQCVNEDQATKTPVETQASELISLAEDEGELLGRIQASLPILADLARGDVFLFRVADSPAMACVVDAAKPETVPSIGAGIEIGDELSLGAEPAIARVLTRGTAVKGYARLRVQGRPTVQDVYPIRSNGQVIGALAIEIGLVESERQKRKSVVFRRAIDRLRRHVIAGRLRGAGQLSRLTEHDGPLVVNGDGQIVYISSLAEQLYRRIGYSHSLLHYNLSSLQTDDSFVARALESETCVEELVQEGPYTWLKRAIPLVGRGEDHLWSRVLERFEPRDPVIVTVHDVTEEVQKERELKIKSAMIQEIHHRVKNNLQTIAALLRLQARRTGSPEVSSMLQETINRILSIAVVHEFLAHQDSSDVDMREVAQQIIQEVTRSIIDSEKRIRFHLDAADVCLPTQQATSCALVLNELLHNTIEHGFARVNEGNVYVRLSTVDDRIVLEVTDEGEGLSPDFDLRRGRNLGLQIVSTLAREDLKGTFQLVNVEPRGARGIVSFPRAT